MKTDKKKITVNGGVLMLELDIGSGGGVPEIIPVFNYGRTTYTQLSGKKSYFLDEKAADQVIAAFDDRGNDAVIDYNHQQLYCKINGQPAIAAGWVIALEKDGDGVKAHVKWTERAKKHIKEKEFRYISPVFKHSEDGTVEYLRHISLTNEPATDNLEPLIAAEFSGETNLADNNPKGENAMKDQMIAILGLDSSAEETAVLAAVKKMKENNDIAANVRGILALEPDASPDAVTGAVNAAIDNAKKAPELAGRLAVLEAAEEQREMNDLISRGLKSGQLTNAMVKKNTEAEAGGKWTKDYLTAYLEMAAPVVPMGELDRSNLAGGNTVALSVEDIEYAQQMGVTEEELIEYRKSQKKG